MSDANKNQTAAAPTQTSEPEAPRPQRMMVPLSNSGALQPRNFPEMIEVAKMIAHSGMVPKDYVGNPGAVLVAMQYGAELGLAPMAAIQNIAVINGRPGLWGDAVKALVISDPRCEDFVEIASPAHEAPKWARCVIKRAGQKVPTDVTFTIEDAKTAQLLGKSGPWTNYPRRMLQLRARAFACRDAFPDKLKGLGMAEELHDYPVVDGGTPQYVDAADIPEGTHKVGGLRQPPAANTDQAPAAETKPAESTPAQESKPAPQQTTASAPAKVEQQKAANKPKPDPRAGF